MEILGRIEQALGEKKLPWEEPKNLDFGDFAVPCFRLAQDKGIAPGQLAAQWAELLAKSPLPGLKEAKAVGPYLNVRLSISTLTTQIVESVESRDFFAWPARPESDRVMVEFSQPNTHKEFHVGHLRNVAIGDALVRLFRKTGFPVIAANYPGDMGAHIARCLWMYKKAGCPPLPQSNVSEFFGKFYTEASITIEEKLSGEEKKKAEAEVSGILRAIESREPEFTQLWQTTRDACLKDLESIYQWLGTKFDHYFFESDLDHKALELVEKYQKQGVFTKSEGAIIVDLEDVKMGVCLVLKSDGTTLYATKDLVLAEEKFKNFQIAKNVYVVGSEQKLHFKQVFEVLKRMGFAQAKDCHHISYELVMLPGGQKMSSRSGNSITLSYVQGKLTDKVYEEFQTRGLETGTPEETRKLARDIVVGALRYGMVSQDPSKKIAFQIDDWLRFEGDTGPYLQYTYARFGSVLRKLNEKIPPVVKGQELKLSLEAERLVARVAYRFRPIVDRAVSELRPNLVANFCFDLAKQLNRFYLECSINHEPDQQIKISRAALIQAVREVLGQGMDLIGIPRIERM